MEAADRKAHLVGDLNLVEHVVGLVAVDLRQDVAPKYLCQRLLPQIARRRIRRTARLVVCRAPAIELRVVVVPLLAVLRGIDPHLADRGDVAHAGGGHPTLLAIDPLGVLAAGHLERLRRPREAELLGYAGTPLVLDHIAAAADKVGRTGQDLHRGHAAAQRPLKARVLYPDGVLRRDLRRGRPGRLVAVVVAARVGRRIDAEVAMGVDDAGGHPLACRVDDLRTAAAVGVDLGCAAAADRCDAAPGESNPAVAERSARAGPDGRVGEDDIFRLCAEERRDRGLPGRAAAADGGRSAGLLRAALGRAATCSQEEQQRCGAETSH